MAITLANLTGALRRAGTHWFLSVLTVSVLGVSHVAWFLSTIAEVYTWSTALFSAELWLLLRLIDNPQRQNLFLLSGVNALGLSLHNFALLPTPFYAGTVLWLWRGDNLSTSDLGWAAGTYLVGATPFLGLIAWATPQLGGVLPATRSALLGRWGSDVLNVSFTWETAKTNYALGALSLANLLPFLSIVGFIFLYRRRRPLAFIFGGIAAAHAAFVARYSVPDMFTFLLPTMVSMTMLGGIGAHAMWSYCSNRRTWIILLLIASTLLPPIGYGTAPAVLDALDVDVERARSLPYRHEARYWLVPWKHNEHSAQRFSQEALQQTQADDLIISDSTPYSPLRLTKHLYHPNSGTKIKQTGSVSFHDLRAVLPQQTIYVVSPVPGYAPSWLLEAGSFERDGVLYRVTALSSPSIR